MRFVAPPPRRRAVAFCAVLAIATLTLASCGGGSPSPEEAWATRAISRDAAFAPLVLNTRLGLGENRLAIAVLDRNSAPVTDAAVTLRLYRLDTVANTDRVTAAMLVFTTDLTPRVMTPSVPHVHADGQVHDHSSTPVAVYTAGVTFDRTGWWGAEITARAEGVRAETTHLKFAVLQRSGEPAIGDLAPATLQPTLADVADISTLDTAQPPDPDLHTLTVAEAIRTGKPVVVAFTTPLFCQTALCGPVLSEAVWPLRERFGDDVILIHIEPYDVEKARQGELVGVPAIEEWGLLTEPWVFVIGPDGRIAAKFEGLVTADELAEAVAATLS